MGADEGAVKPDATPEEVKQVLESENPQIFSQAVSLAALCSSRAAVISFLPSYSTRTDMAMPEEPFERSRSGIRILKRLKRR